MKKLNAPSRKRNTPGNNASWCSWFARALPMSLHPLEKNEKHGSNTSNRWVRTQFVENCTKEIPCRFLSAMQCLVIKDSEKAAHPIFHATLIYGGHHTVGYWKSFFAIAGVTKPHTKRCGLHLPMRARRRILPSSVVAHNFRVVLRATLWTSRRGSSVCQRYLIDTHSRLLQDRHTAVIPTAK